jgi:hypothetical protein
MEAISPYRSSQFAPALSGLPPDPAPPSVMQGMIDWRPALLARRLRCSAGGAGSAGCAGTVASAPSDKAGADSTPDRYGAQVRSSHVGLVAETRSESHAGFRSRQGNRAMRAAYGRP